MIGEGLDACLARHAAHGNLAAATVQTVLQLAATGIEIAEIIAEGAIGGALADPVGAANTDGDAQRGLDLLADERFLAGLASSPVGLYASEELAEPVAIGSGRPLVLAIDPLDGSSNIDTNVPIGTIFSIREMIDDADPQASFKRPGREQLAAGFLIYGPRTALVLTLGAGTDIYVHSRTQGGFRLAAQSCAIPLKTREFAINASNYRHWDEAVRLYFDDCIKGGHGPRESEFNMRWIASLVAEAYRVLIRGGVFLYPGDRRRGYGQGRLRLVYEAHPIAMLIEQAGGLATDTVEPILDIAASSLHQRVPLVFGSAHEVNRIGRYHTLPSQIAERAPLFGKRGLFQELTDMSARHPIISITGSSGAGTTSVKNIFEQIFRREGITAATIEGDSFHRYDRAAMKAKVAAEEAAGNPNFTHFHGDANELEILEEIFAEYGRSGTGRSRYYIHDEDEALARGCAPGTFTDWAPFPESDLLFYEGLHGCAVTDKANIAQHADLKIGVVPVINLEWIQKIHRDKAARGYTTDDVQDTILRRMPDYVNFIMPQFALTDINFQRVPVVDTSNPFIARWIPTPDESMLVIRFARPRGIDFPYLLSMIPQSFMSRPNSIVCPGNKLDLAMQLILTPLIMQLIERQRRLS